MQLLSSKNYRQFILKDTNFTEKMPASSIDLYRMQDARNNFDVMRPAPICADADQFMGQCQNIHVSTNCYYGYHDPKLVEKYNDVRDCEMTETSDDIAAAASVTSLGNAKKRSADDSETPSSKRFCEEVQRKNNIEPETNEMLRVDSSTEDLLESLYWNIHGGNIFRLAQCP